VVQFWLTSVFSLLAAVSGGWIAGRYAVHAQKHAVKEQRTSDLEAERRAVNGTLQAIKTELEVFNTELVGELKSKFGDWDRQKPSDQQQDQRKPFDIPPVTHNYFIVYDLNAGMLGRITKAELTKKVVTTYARAKSLMDAVNYYAPRYQERDRLSRGVGSEPTQAQDMDPGLRQWANQTIRERLGVVERNLPGLVEDIQKYLES
jgi:Mg2+ and Co2+ transporter CorA